MKIPAQMKKIRFWLLFVGVAILVPFVMIVGSWILGTIAEQSMEPDAIHAEDSGDFICTGSFDDAVYPCDFSEFSSLFFGGLAFWTALLLIPMLLVISPAILISIFVSMMIINHYFPPEVKAKTDRKRLGLVLGACFLSEFAICALWMLMFYILTRL